MRHHGSGIRNQIGRGHVFDVGRDLDLLQIDRNTEHDRSTLGLCNIERFRYILEHASEAVSSDVMGARGLDQRALTDLLIVPTGIDRTFTRENDEWYSAVGGGRQRCHQLGDTRPTCHRCHAYLPRCQGIG